MSRSDFYASPFGIAYSTYMERPWLSRLVARIIWGADVRPYYESMAAVAEVGDGGTIVDCPCGAGPAFRALAPRQDVRYIAVDLSPSMLRRAGRRARDRGLSQIEMHRGDATEIPLADSSADLFLSYWGLHCFDDPSASLAEAARVLAPAGRLVGSTFVKEDENLRQRLLLRPGAADFGPIGDGEEVVEWLHQAGFPDPVIRRSGPMLFFDAQLG